MPGGAGVGTDQSAGDDGGAVHQPDIDLSLLDPDTSTKRVIDLWRSEARKNMTSSQNTLGFWGQIYCPREIVEITTAWIFDKSIGD